MLLTKNKFRNISIILQNLITEKYHTRAQDPSTFVDSFKDDNLTSANPVYSPSRQSCQSIIDRFVKSMRSRGMDADQLCDMLLKFLGTKYSNLDDETKQIINCEDTRTRNRVKVCARYSMISSL